MYEQFLKYEKRIYDLHRKKASQITSNKIAYPSKLQLCTKSNFNFCNVVDSILNFRHFETLSNFGSLQ